MNFFSFKTSLLILLLCFFQKTNAKNISVLNQKGENAREKLERAYLKAKPGDVIIIDTDIIFDIDQQALILNKSNITIKGKQKKEGKFKLERINYEDYILKVTGSNNTIENITFSKGRQQLYFITKNTTKNTLVKNCSFVDSKYTGINFRGNYINTQIINSYFENCKFSLQTMDCPILKDFTVDNCKFTTGDHQISLDNPLAPYVDHKNIKITNCYFGLTKRFNLALANTQNVVISNCTFLGGTGPYSQALHFEDRTKDVLVTNNNIKCLADVAILLFATDKIGHGTGRRLTEEEKQAAGSGNITLDNNIIESGKADAAISIGYGVGFLKINGNNSIKSKNLAITSFKSENSIKILIDDETYINNTKYKDIKLLETSIINHKYILLSRSIYD